MARARTPRIYGEAAGGLVGALAGAAQGAVHGGLGGAMLGAAAGYAAEEAAAAVGITPLEYVRGFINRGIDHAIAAAKRPDNWLLVIEAAAICVGTEIATLGTLGNVSCGVAVAIAAERIIEMEAARFAGDELSHLRSEASAGAFEQAKRQMGLDDASMDPAVRMMANAIEGSPQFRAAKLRAQQNALAGLIQLGIAREVATAEQLAGSPWVAVELGRITDTYWRQAIGAARDRADNRRLIDAQLDAAALARIVAAAKRDMQRITMEWLDREMTRRAGRTYTALGRLQPIGSTYQQWSDVRAELAASCYAAVLAGQPGPEAMMATIERAGADALNRAAQHAADAGREYLAELVSLGGQQRGVLADNAARLFAVARQDREITGERHAGRVRLANAVQARAKELVTTELRAQLSALAQVRLPDAADVLALRLRGEMRTRRSLPAALDATRAAAEQMLGARRQRLGASNPVQGAAMRRDIAASLSRDERADVRASVTAALVAVDAGRKTPWYLTAPALAGAGAAVLGLGAAVAVGVRRRKGRR